jgi:hydrogenase expression/formation protein HypC
MCLAVPGRIASTVHRGVSRIGRVQFGGVTREALLDLVPEAGVGDYVLVHVGVAISKIDDDEAQRTLELLREAGALEEDVS